MIYRIELCRNEGDLTIDGFVEAESEKAALWKAAGLLDSPESPKDAWQEDTSYGQLSLFSSIEDEDGETILNEMMATQVILDVFETN